MSGCLKSYIQGFDNSRGGNDAAGARNALGLVRPSRRLDPGVAGGVALNLIVTSDQSLDHGPAVRTSHLDFVVLQKEIGSVQITRLRGPRVQRGLGAF